MAIRKDKLLHKIHRIRNDKEPRKERILDGKNLLDFYNSKARYKLIAGPIGSGKSTVCAFELLIDCLTIPPTKLGIRRSAHAVVRNTRLELLQTTLQTFEAVVEEEGFTEFIAFNKQEMRYTLRIPPEFTADNIPIEATIWCMGLDDNSAIGHLLSFELTSIWFNEMAKIKPMFFENSVGRIGRFPSQNSRMEGLTDTDYKIKIRMDTNMPNLGDWLQYKMDAKDGNWDVFKQPSGLSPEAESKKFLTQNYYENYANENKSNPELVNVYVHAKYGSKHNQRAVFASCWNHGIHTDMTNIEPLGNKPIYVGVDCTGFHPASIFYYISGEDTVVVIGELAYPKDKDMDWLIFIEESKAFEWANYGAGRKFERLGDPKGQDRDRQGNSNIDIARSRNYKIVPSLISDNNIERRIQLVKYFLGLRDTKGQAKIRIHPVNCPKLIEGFQGGYYFTTALARGTEEIKYVPYKNEFADLHDALQYGLATKNFYNIFLNKKNIAMNVFELKWGKKQLTWTQRKQQNTMI